MFTRLEVIVLTNKQTPLKTSNALCYATTLDKEMTDGAQHIPKVFVDGYQATFL